MALGKELSKKLSMAIKKFKSEKSRKRKESLMSQDIKDRI